jgi:GST-like protein
MVGDEYSIADLTLWPWIRTLNGFYEAGEELEMSSYSALNAWFEKCMSRPASEKSTNIPKRD